jgi:glycosyltransferase involved in cell wall biosynthesis
MALEKDKEKLEGMKRRQLRHCMVVHAYYPLGETRVEREALALLEQSLKVDVICLKGPREPAIELVDGVRVYRLPVRRRRGSGFLIQLLEYLTFFILSSFHLSRLHLQHRYDVVQIHNLPDFLVFAAMIPKLTGAKIILDLHDLMPEFYSERSQWSMKSLPVRILLYQERVACYFADKVITVTEIWRQTLIRRGQPTDKVFVVMNLADNRYFHQNGTVDAVESDRFELIYHGIMGRRHGLDLVLNAMDIVRKKTPNIHITLHGSGEFRPRLEEMVGELRLEDHVSFSKEFVPTAQLVELIRTADLGIVPYRDDVFTGGILPTKLMEYAALGVPAVAARTSGISGYFDESMIAFFDPGDVDQLVDSILKLSEDRSQLVELAQNITAFNERYIWNEHSEMYVKLIVDLIGF